VFRFFEVALRDPIDIAAFFLPVDFLPVVTAINTDPNSLRMVMPQL
jgi:hypothetical protein